MAKQGEDWDPLEVDRVVAEYFWMLEAQRTGMPFVKLHRAKSLASEIERSRGSVEFKHQNISAVLQELSVAPLQGYAPRRNYQKLLVDAVEKAVLRNPWVLEPTEPRQQFASPTSIFEDKSPPPRNLEPLPEPMRRLIGKFDPVARDLANSALGRAGEELALNYERNRLADGGRPDLSQNVRWVSQEDGDGAGFDILSFDLSGRERLIEVKTTNGTQRTPFFLSRNEESLSRERPDQFQIFRIYDFSRAPRAFRIDPPLSDHVRLEAESYRASFG